MLKKSLRDVGPLTEGPRLRQGAGQRMLEASRTSASTSTRSLYGAEVVGHDTSIEPYRKRASFCVTEGDVAKIRKCVSKQQGVQRSTLLGQVKPGHWRLDELF